jgi:hypothetical protein
MSESDDALRSRSVSFYRHGTSVIVISYEIVHRLYERPHMRTGPCLALIRRRLNLILFAFQLAGYWNGPGSASLLTGMVESTVLGSLRREVLHPRQADCTTFLNHDFYIVRMG